MLSYVPGDSLAHRLDPRTKLAVQVAFAAAAYVHTTPRWLAGFTLLVGATLVASHTPPLRALVAFRFPVALLAVAPLIQGLVLGPPWFSVVEAWPPALAAYRVLLILLVTAAYVRTTPVRDTRAAIARLVPGRPGRFLGVGVGLVLRFLPRLLEDLRRSREATWARLGDRRPLHERMRIVATAGLSRAFGRADALSLALRARCLSWNPTPPALRFGRVDAVGWAVALGLVVAALV